VWEYLSHSFAHVALVAGTLPDHKYIDTVSTWAQPGALLLFDLGYVKGSALALIAQAEAYFLTRLNHQTALSSAVAGRLQRTELLSLWPGESRSLVEHLGDLGAGERLAGRLSAARVPEAVVNERRRKARATAKQRGYPPSQAPLTLLAWNLFLPHVPSTVWTPLTIGKAYSLRWQVALVFKSWKRDLPLATLPTKTEPPPLCALSGRLLLLVLVYALCPALRPALWTRQHRERSFLKLVRDRQACADRWLQALFASTAILGHLLSHSCVSAQRVITKASRKRPTSAQRLRKSIETQNDCIEFTIKLAA
jgi:hypothetical protein